MKRLNIWPYSIVFIFSTIFLSTSASALDISASIKDEGRITFTVINDSKSDIKLNLGQFHRENLFLSVGYGDQVILKENWIPESSNYRMGVLGANKSVSFDIDLNKRFESLDRMLKEKCLFLFWGGVFNIGNDERAVKSGSVLLNKEVCKAPPSDEEFW